jgi:hypothetical protein
MSTETSTGMKSCCACGADVAGQPRMKDSQGRYWCVACGEADQKKKAIASPTAPCAGCHQAFAKGKLEKLGEHFFCKACLKKRSKVGGSRVTPAAPAMAASTTHAHAGGAMAMPRGGHGDHRRAIMMAAVLMVLILFAVFYHFVILAD